MGIHAPADVADALTQEVLKVNFDERVRDIEAREATVAGRIKGERMDKVPEGAFRESLHYGTGQMEELEIAQRSQADTREADAAVSEGLRV